jgi:lysine 6-dehydrogenase
MSFVVVGAGRQGVACAYDLLRFTEHDVVLVDRDEPRLPSFLSGFGERLRLRRLDASDAAGLAELMRGAVAACNAAPYFLNLPVTRAALEAGVHVCDLGGNTEIVLRQLELDGEARARGCSVLPDCGLAPGLVNILAARCIEELDRTESIRIFTGGLPQNPRPPLGYQVVYSLDGVLDYYTSTAIGLEGGEVVHTEPLTQIERVDFPGVGELEAFVTAGGISTLPYTYRGRVGTMIYKTLRYPGHAEKMRVLKELGLLSVEEVSVNGGTRVRPREVTKAVLQPLLGEGKDLVVIRVEATGERGGTPRRLRYDLLDRYEEATGITAMERTTGFGLAISGQLQAAGRIPPGAHTPDQAVPAVEYLDALARRGVVVQRSELPPG